MNTQQTSIDAYYTLNNLGARQAQVYNMIRLEGPMSNLEIADHLHMPINSITPRTKELVEKGVVKEAYRAPSPITGRKVIFWEVK